MRRGELLKLLWKNVDLERRVAKLPTSKNGKGRAIPLSTRAVATLRSLPRSIDGRVFPLSADAVKSAWVRMKKRARESYEQRCCHGGEEPKAYFLDLRFHDLRHEGTSRLAKKVPNVIELSSITGHKDLNMLARYYHTDAEELAMKIG